MQFCKFQGFGNDYLVFAADDLAGLPDIGEFARRACDRHFGVGGDGIAVWEKLTNGEADFNIRIINPDGSEAGFSGNGTRCAVAYLYYRDVWRRESVTLSTLSGFKKYTLLETVTPGHYWFQAEIGQPKFAPAEIPFDAETASCQVIDFPLPLKDAAMNVAALNVGNPVCVVFVADFAALDWREIGAEIESHPMFPRRTNVVFVKPIDSTSVEIRIWERGAGETPSSGTCSAAAAVASAYTGKTGRRVEVHAPGGATEIFWQDGGEILLKGRADLVFCGEYPYSC
jgi:diaminopimelate epimerase